MMIDVEAGIKEIKLQTLDQFAGHWEIIKKLSSIALYNIWSQIKNLVLVKFFPKRKDLERIQLLIAFNIKIGELTHKKQFKRELSESDQKQK